MAVTLYHGTTASRADQIVRGGFVSKRMADEIGAVALEYDISFDELNNFLAQQDRFATSANREDRVWFAGSLILAASWAQRSPEVRWEALTCVYRLRHPELGDYWNQSDALHWWLLRERLEDPPVVVTVAVDDDLTDFPASLISKLPDIHLPAPQPSTIVKGVEHVPWRLDGSSIRYLAGFEPDDHEDFASEVDRGLWPQPAGQHLGKPWWDWDEFRQHLSEARLNSLWALE
jgi:hypothetical protein